VDQACSTTTPCCSGICATADGLNLCQAGDTGCVCEPPG
jgi:hypothetical protein